MKNPLPAPKPQSPSKWKKALPYLYSAVASTSAPFFWSLTLSFEEMVSWGIVLGLGNVAFQALSFAGSPRYKLLAHLRRYYQTHYPEKRVRFFKPDWSVERIITEEALLRGPLLPQLPTSILPFHYLQSFITGVREKSPLWSVMAGLWGAMVAQYELRGWIASNILHLFSHVMVDRWREKAVTLYAKGLKKDVFSLLEEHYGREGVEPLHRKIRGLMLVENPELFWEGIDNLGKTLYVYYKSLPPEEKTFLRWIEEWKW